MDSHGTMKRSDVLSILFGLGGALVVAFIGPVYAAPLLIVAVPVLFLTISRAVTGSPIQPDLAWLLLAFAIAWLVVLPIAPIAPIVRSSGGAPADAWIYWIGLGIIPLLLAISIAVRRRLFDAHDIRRH